MSEFLGLEDILFDVPGDRKGVVLAGVAARLAENLGKSQGAVLAALLRRERLGPTSVGGGIAIPHARMEGIAAPAAVLARLQRAVSFGAPEDEEVDLLLALIWPRSEAKGFVPALHHATRLLRRSEFRHRLRRSRTPAEAHAFIRKIEAGRSGSADAGDPGWRDQDRPRKAGR